MHRPEQVDGLLAETLGLPPPAVTAITGIVRAGVADAVHRLLPGVADSTAPRYLIVAAAGLVTAAPQLARGGRPELTAGHANAAALPGMLLHVLTAQLLDRYAAAHPDRPFAQHAVDAEPPAPAPALRTAYHAYAQELTLIDRGGGIRSRALQLADAMADAVPGALTRRWGGWALLAAKVGLDAHQDQLPAPGRPRRRSEAQQAGADAAGYAFQLGRTLLTAVALATLDAPPLDPGT